MKREGTEKLGITHGLSDVLMNFSEQQKKVDVDDISWRRKNSK